MSKNSKNRKRTVAAKERNRVKGFKGPARTTKTNTKKRAWYQLKDANGRLLVLTNKGKDAKAKSKGRGRHASANDEEALAA